MFHSARLKLTAWYLLIIMFVSITFSLVIYRGLTGEVDRAVRLERFRSERRHSAVGLPSPVFLDPDFIN